MEKLTIPADPPTPSDSSAKKTSDQIVQDMLLSHRWSIKKLLHQSYQKVVSYVVEKVFTPLSSFFITATNKFLKKNYS